MGSADIILTFFDIFFGIFLQAGHELIFLCESDPGARQVWFLLDMSW